MTSPHLETIHHEGHDPALFSPFVPAIACDGSRFVQFSGMTAAPSYHEHPHRHEVFDAIPPNIAGQVELLLANLDLALAAAGCGRGDVVNLLRFFTHVADDQDVVNRAQAEWFGGHVPTSTSVEVTRLATDPRLRLEIQALAVRPPAT